MAVKTAAELAIEVTSSTKDATAGFADVGNSAADMSRDVDKANRSLGLSADAADELGGKAGAATGALGALSSGFELVGAEKYAGALQSASMATDFLSGVGDSLNLVMQSTILQNARARAATVARTVAEKAAAAGTAVMTAAQWALNVALSANPITLIVIGVVALIAVLVLLVAKCRPVREFVAGTFDKIKAAAATAFNWVKNNWPLLLAIITGPIGLAVLAITKNWDKIKTGFGAVKTFITDRFSALPAALAGIATRIKDTLLAPFKAVYDLVEKLIKKIKDIKLPKIDLNPFNNGGDDRRSGSSSSSSSSRGGSGRAQIVQITVNGALDPVAVARQIDALVGAQTRRTVGVGL